MGLDEIIVLREGEMIGRGTHAELMETCPEYRDIYRTQMSDVTRAPNAGRREVE